MVILNKLVNVIDIIICLIHSSHFIDLCEAPFLISVHLKISALFVVSHLLRTEVSPEIMEVKINPGFRTQKKCPFPLNRGHSSH